MPRSFTQLWTRVEFEAWQRADGPLLRHAASNQFTLRGLRPGDTLFILSCFSGKVWLIGALVVDVGPLDWHDVQRLGLIQGTRFSGLRDHVFADPQQTAQMRFDLTIPLEVARGLRFGNGEGPKLRSCGGVEEVDPQTFRGVREINPASAGVLSRLLLPAPGKPAPAPEKMRALSIRQPYVERILRGEKKVEYRSWPTRYRGKVYIYAAKTLVNLPGHHDSLDPMTLPRGVIVGTMEIVDCQRGEQYFEWQLAQPVRFPKPLSTQAMPQAGFFFPFGRA